jgi:undecaprenyl-diphosphatase
MKQAIVLLFILLLGAFYAPQRCNGQNIDYQILNFFNRQRKPAGDAVMSGLSASVYPLSAAMPLGQLMYGYTTHDSASIRRGWQTVGSMGINAVITLGLKYTINRVRPYVRYANLNPYTHEGDPSFPSGHTSYSFALATSLSLEYKSVYVRMPAYLWAASVGISRLYLGEHYPSDVVVGALCGAGSAWLAYKGQKFLYCRRHTPAIKAQ